MEPVLCEQALGGIEESLPGAAGVDNGGGRAHSSKLK
jgi:hypothetical protein